MGALETGMRGADMTAPMRFKSPDHERPVGPSVGVVLVGGAFSPGGIDLIPIGNRSVQRLPVGSTSHRFRFRTFFNFGFVPGLQNAEVDRLVGKIQEVVNLHDGQPAILVTHSYGGTMGRKAIREQPQLVAGIVQLSRPGERFRFIGDGGELPDGVLGHNVHGLFDPVVPIPLGSTDKKGTHQIVLGGHVAGVTIGPGVNAAAEGVYSIYASRIQPTTVFDIT